MRPSLTSVCSVGGSSSGGGGVGCSTLLVETMDKHNPAMGLMRTNQSTVGERQSRFLGECFQFNSKCSAIYLRSKLNLATAQLFVWLQFSQTQCLPNSALMYLDDDWESHKWNYFGQENKLINSFLVSTIQFNEMHEIGFQSNIDEFNLLKRFAPLAIPSHKNLFKVYILWAAVSPRRVIWCYYSAATSASSKCRHHWFCESKKQLYRTQYICIYLQSVHVTQPESSYISANAYMYGRTLVYV